MSTTTRTTEQEDALIQIQKSLGSEAIELADRFAAMFADVLPDDVDREVSNLGHLLMLTLKKTAPHLPEATQYGLPFAFIEMVRERTKSQRPTSRA
jgi:hypothetical protein